MEKKQCATEGCALTAVGKSKYCKTHRDIARQQWKAMVDDQAHKRALREKRFIDVFARAYEAGIEAGKAKQPTPMVVQQHANCLDDTSPVEKEWYVPEGPCGFAQVIIRPGNSSFARWLKKSGRADTHVYGGVYIHVSAHGQSYERKQAHAEAMVKVLEAEIEGIQAYARSWMD